MIRKNKSQLLEIFTELKKLTSVDVINKNTIIIKRTGTIYKYDDELDIYAPEKKDHEGKITPAREIEIAEAEALLWQMKKASGKL